MDTHSFSILRKVIPLLIGMALIGNLLHAQPIRGQDSLRGSITPERAWWDVMRYDLAFSPDYDAKYIEGIQSITFVVTDTGRSMQVDLQHPMRILSAEHKGGGLELSQNGNAWYLQFDKVQGIGDTLEVLISFSGKPRVAVNPPWDGGWIWTKDKKGRPWMTAAVQGLGASAWFPCKDHQSDEPDLGASISITVPDTLVAVANGRLMAMEKVGENLMGFAWEVKNPINSYNMIPYIGHYAHWEDSFEGLDGTLSLDFWVLDYELEAAKTHFTQVQRMLVCFEDWLGPYPFYEDGYKLVQSPHLGMEHQSAIAYGNQFGNGYRGADLSSSGWGLKWDFIIIHESGHEWFGNSITTADIADMWVHESFTAYTEALFTECNYGASAGEDYIIGTRRSILNDKPIIGPYGVNKRGSGDMYYKGANMLHTMRHIVDNDSLFKEMLRGLNAEFYHSIVRTEQVEAYINEFTGIDFTKVFDQFLRQSSLPVLEYSLDKGKLYHRWTQCVEGFDMPLRLEDGMWLRPNTAWQSVQWDAGGHKDLPIDRNFMLDKRLVAGVPRGVK